MVGRTANGTGQKMDNTFLKNLIGFKADDVFVILTFQEFIKIRQGKGGISSEVAAQAPFPVTLNDGFQNLTLTISAVDIARAKGTPFQIAKLVEQEKGMIAGAAEVTIVRRSLLFAMGRTDATVHVENDHLRRATVMNTVDPDPVMSAKASMFASVARRAVSKHLIWRVDAACLSTALPPTIHRMAGSRPRRSASFTSS